jgi:para-aminobenzoate synthetase component 1
VHEIAITADDLVAALMVLSDDENVCLLDSCGVGHLGSHLLIAGVRPVNAVELRGLSVEETLQKIDDLLSGDLASIFTLSYDFGKRLQNIDVAIAPVSDEPDVFVAQFDGLVVHDYQVQKTFITGNEEICDDIEERIIRPLEKAAHSLPVAFPPDAAVSNFTKDKYIESIEAIKELIRSGDTYQTNLTQQITVQTSSSPSEIFSRVRRDHPAPFASFLRRNDSIVVSASPERFLKIANGIISASPIKGTRARGNTPAADAALRNELLTSEKDRAENTMIVDLLRNDLGRVCEFGSVEVEKLCDLEEHPTLFHLVSTITGKLRDGVSFSDILKATFPCGSITGAPKIRTMKIIDELEPDNRGLSMGAIGIHVPPQFGISDALFDMSVAIRTMTIRDGEAVFNVGGGITIESDPESEYDESLLKAKALLKALRSEPPA